MNEIWKGIVPTVRVDVPLQVHTVLAQAPTQPVAPAQPGVFETGTTYVEGLGQSIWAFMPTLLGATVILLVGLLIALIASFLTRSLLNRTRLDNKIADWITGRQ